MKKVVTVTKDDIAKGKKNVSKKCPIALALKRVFPNATETYAGYALYVEQPDDDLRSDAPGAVLKFMAAFDEGVKVKPFKFSATFSEA